MGAIDTFQIDKKSNIPIWVQLKQRIVHLIRFGEYQPGDQLPTVRQLSIQLGVNYHTVNKVYKDLENDGLIEQMIGRGTFVTDLSEAQGLSGQSDADLIASEVVQKLLSLGMTSEEILDLVAHHLVLHVDKALSAAKRNTGKGMGNGEE